MDATQALIQPRAQEQIAVASGRAAALLGEARALKIVDGTSREYAANLRSQITTYSRKLEWNRIALVKPLNDHVKRINDGFRGPVQTLEQALTAIDAELRRDRMERQRIAEEARRKADEEERRLRAQAEDEARARADAEAEKARKEALAAGFGKKDAKELAELTKQDELAKPVAAPVVQTVVPPAPAKTQVTEAGARVTFRKDWDVEVLNLDLVPVKYLKRELRKSEVLRDVRAGRREIPGLRIFETETPTG